MKRETGRGRRLDDVQILGVKEVTMVSLIIIENDHKVIVLVFVPGINHVENTLVAPQTPLQF